MLKEAMLYEKLDSNLVHCYLCSHHCKIGDGKLGICRVRKNINGTLFSLSYGKLIACNVDPIEKKPIFHLLPGSSSLSIATMGCNFRCSFCQNWQISQASKDGTGELPGEYVTPEKIIRLAQEYHTRSISYTYTEPTIFFEYAYEIAKQAKEKGIYNIFVTNGFMTREMLEMSKGIIDAANVDLKSFRDEYYKKVCGGRLEPVLDSIKLMKKLGMWIEITTLLVPGMNDSEPELNEIADFIFSCGRDIPWHISRFHPDYDMMDLPATSTKALEIARLIGINKGLKYVYVGNLPHQGWEDTICHSCKNTLIERSGYSILQNNLIGPKCSFCKATIEGIF